jgi:hypothetical protein
MQPAVRGHEQINGAVVVVVTPITREREHIVGSETRQPIAQRWRARGHERKHRRRAGQVGLVLRLGEDDGLPHAKGASRQQQAAHFDPGFGLHWF